MKVINYGKVNNCTLYAVEVGDRLYPLSKDDLEFQKPDYKINYDSGVYPSITDIEQYICNQVALNEMTKDAEAVELTLEDARLLGQLTTRDEDGTHFTQTYDTKWLLKMEKAGYIEIHRPVHGPTGIAYGQEEWSVEVTPAGIEAGEELNWGE
ncbi:MAG: hypothetical protein K6T65_16005 [Peptococcaceae bacterium]|nr:hypothetical protein [Peptococcaceae bacterium]